MRRVKDIKKADNIAPLGTPFASGSYESGYGCTKTGPGTGDANLEGKHCYTNINDQVKDNQHSWVPQRDGDKFVGIAFKDGSAVNVTGFAISRDMSGKLKDRLGGIYRVQWTLVPNPTADSSKDDWKDLNPTFTRDTPLKQVYHFGPPLLCTGLRIFIDSTFKKYRELPAIDEFRIYKYTDKQEVLELERETASSETVSWIDTASWNDWLASDRVFYPSFLTLLVLLCVFTSSLLCTKPEPNGDHYEAYLDMNETLLEAKF